MEDYLSVYESMETEELISELRRYYGLRKEGCFNSDEIFEIERLLEERDYIIDDAFYEEYRVD